MHTNMLKANIKNNGGLMQKAECEKVGVLSGYVEVMGTIKGITPHTFPLERDRPHSSMNMTSL